MIRNKMYKLKNNHLILALIIGTAVISVWRGIWNLLDLYLYPSDIVMSSIISIIVGLGILIVTHQVAKELM
jgi:hypothetical protein